MTDTLSWIAGLMKQNYDAVGFLPFDAVRTYIKTGHYILQHDIRGNLVGYLLHGRPVPGGILSVAQHCIEIDKRFSGYGTEAFNTLLDRAQQSNCRGIKVRCADDLPSTEFWLKMGMGITRIDHPSNRRRRAINTMMLDLYPSLFPLPFISLKAVQA